MVNIDTRVLNSRVLDKSQNEAQLKMVFRNFPTIEENIKFLDAKVEVCKSYWKTFHM